MRKALALLVFLSMFTVAYAQPRIITQKSLYTVYIGETTKIPFIVENPSDESDLIELSVWPPFYTKLQNETVELKPRTNFTTYVSISLPPSLKDGTRVIQLKAKSLKTGDEYTKSVFLSLERRTGVYLAQVTLKKGIIEPGDKVELDVLVTNLDEESREVRLEATWLTKDNKVVISKIFELAIPKKSSKVVSVSFNTTKFQKPGDYQVRVKLIGQLGRLLGQESVEFTVKEVKKLKKSKDVNYGFLKHDVTITIVNEGNVEFKNLEVCEYIPKFLESFFYPEQRPTSKEVLKGRIAYCWLLESLKPGDSATIKYEVRYVNLVVLIIILLGLATIAVWATLSPKVTKTYHVKPSREIVVRLHVKNRGKRTIKDVVVRDVVPPTVKLVKEFETLKPKLKKVPNGIELIWRLGDLKPGEERVLTYKLKPYLEVLGSFMLPKAVLTYRGLRGKTKRKVSKEVEITTHERFEV